MYEDRYYEAKKYARSLDYSHDKYKDYHKALVDILYGCHVHRREFMKLANEAGIDLMQPDARSEHPHPVLWWNVDLPNHVLLARDGEQSNYWAFTTTDERLSKQLAEAWEREEQPKIDALMNQ